MENRTVVVTGGNRGIGKAIALFFASRGEKVAIIGRDEKTLKDVEFLGTNLAGEIKFFQTDISSKEQVISTFASIREHFGEVDILVNNAGINTREDFANTNFDLWDQEIAINLSGTFYCTQQVIPSMVNRKKGWVIMISSVKAFEGSRSLSYGASKAGMVSLTKSYARAVSKFGVRVNCIAPSMVETDMAKLWSEEDKVKYLKSIPVGRFAQAEEIANLVGFVCSKDGDFISGSVLGVDGGYFV